jgi:hypothetical protein
MAQALEHLLCKHGTLSSNPSPIKKKKKKEKKRIFLLYVRKRKEFIT